MEEKISVIGLGYVGLPLALALARQYSWAVGYDKNADKVKLLLGGIDPTDEGYGVELKGTTLRIVDDPKKMSGATFFIVGVPTPVDADNRPDLEPLRSACVAVGKVLAKGAVVVFESTVYPGVTEEICGPLLASTSGLRQGIDFKLGYSPERMNPGDKEHSLEKITKVVSAEDAESLDRVSEVYGKIVKAGIYKAASIKVAEAAKVIENTQRDLNIALMNELAIVFDKMGISTKDVLDAASTKWNFLRFSPGLVGGHCIGVDPYYLTTKAEQLGYHPHVILAGRRINDGMGVFIAQRMVKLMVNAGRQMKGSRIGILGITFKENVSDVRNSRIPSIVSELKAFGVQVLVHDPYASSEGAHEEYGIELASKEEFKQLDGLIFAVAHKAYLELAPGEIYSMVKNGGVIIDVKSALDRSKIPSSLVYWSL